MTQGQQPAPPSLAGGLLSQHQRLPTSGARAVLAFGEGADLRLAVPQLAIDVAGQLPSMNGGDSDTDMLLFRWAGGRFVADAGLRVPGGEDAAMFRIGDDVFLATASVRTGRGPYDLNAASTVFRRAGQGWVPFQSFDTFAAKQWHAFSIGGRHFLALAQGVTLPGTEARHPRTSRIYEWDGARFAAFQILDGGWGYNWASFGIGGRQFLAYADHTSASHVMAWDGTRFAPFQDLAPQGGRAFQFFEADGRHWLAFANLTGGSMLFRWDGARFAPAQPLDGPGAREFCLIRTADALYLVQVNFIHGTPADPKTDLTSVIYRWGDGRLTAAGGFPTAGGTDAVSFCAGGQRYLAVANSLSAAVRFREDTVIYRFHG